VWHGFGWYVFHLSNFHIATLPDWPGGTNHFWSLAMQQQFYLIWPFVIWFVPRKWLVPALLAFTAIGPTTRFFYDSFKPWFVNPGILTWCNLDYFGIGALFALAVHRGMALDSPGLKLISCLGLAGYLAIFGAHEMKWQTFGLRPLQQTFLAIAWCGFIAGGLAGYGGPIGKCLESAFLQRVGQVSYGIYLFHNLAPLVAGKLFFFLWWGPFDSLAGEVLRIPVYGGVTWALTIASWRWIEKPLQDVRAKIGGR
jgi:peptidoglycan/LPS O-acetylase OafA/YrhL